MLAQNPARKFVWDEFRGGARPLARHHGGGHHSLIGCALDRGHARPAAVAGPRDKTLRENLVVQALQQRGLFVTFLIQAVESFNEELSGDKRRRHLVLRRSRAASEA